MAKSPWNCLLKAIPRLWTECLLSEGKDQAELRSSPGSVTKFELRLEYRTEGLHHIDVRTAFKTFFEAGSGGGSRIPDPSTKPTGSRSFIMEITTREPISA